MPAVFRTKPVEVSNRLEELGWTEELLEVAESDGGRPGSAALKTILVRRLDGCPGKTAPAVCGKLVT